MNPFYDLHRVPQAQISQPFFFLFFRSGRFIRLLKIQCRVVSIDTRVSRFTHHGLLVTSILSNYAEAHYADQTGLRFAVAGCRFLFHILEKCQALAWTDRHRPDSRRLGPADGRSRAA